DCRQVTVASRLLRLGGGWLYWGCSGRMIASRRAPRRAAMPWAISPPRSRSPPVAADHVNPRRRRASMRIRARSSLGIAGLAVLPMTAAACGGSTAKNNTNSSTTTSLNSGVQALNPGSGSPQKGGTLNLVGVGDVDYMDYNISYYTIGALAQRMWLRGLYA